MTRIRRIRDRLGWSQKQMAEHLGCSQPTIARMEAGQDEPGPVARLLDLLEASALAASGVTDGPAEPEPAATARPVAPAEPVS